MTFFIGPETVSDSAPQVFQAISEVKSSSDGFVFLAIILHRLLPQFGGSPVDILTEIGNLIPIHGDFQNRAIVLSNYLELSRMMVPSNLFFSRYLKQLNRCEGLNAHLAPYDRDLANHLRNFGDSVPYGETIADVYRHLLGRKCSTTLIIHNDDSLAIIPSANYGYRQRLVCEVCDKPHNTDDCHICGTAFMPPSLARKVIRYNELHGSTPKMPKTDKLQVPFRPQHQKPKATANMVEASVPVTDSAPIPTQNPSTSPVTEVIFPTPTTNVEDDDDFPPPVAQDHSTNAISPSAGLAKYSNTSEDYVHFIFPEAHMAQILDPSAMMTCAPATNDSSVFTSAEQDILFSHQVLKNHKTMDKEFHVDWGSNIVIINSLDAFTEL